MNNSTKYIIMVVLVFGLGSAVYFLGGGDGTDKELEGRMVESINWEKDYHSESKHPYGTYFIRNILEKGLSDHSVTDIEVSVEAYFDSSEIQLNDELITYFFVGKSFNLYNNEVDSLLSFVASGNNMFVAAEFLPKRFLSTLFNNYNDYNYFGYTEDTLVNLGFEESKFSNNYDLVNFEKDIAKKRRWRNVNYGLDYQFDGKDLGKAGYRPCYLRFKYGAGTILVHTIPQAFSNKFLSTDNGREYVEIALSYFPKSAILFDNFTQFAYNDGTMEIDYGDNSYSNNGHRLSDHRTLDFLLTNVQLRWGYFILLIALFLFVVFKGKREQKIMPTTTTNSNSSLEFTETIARLYLKQNQHNKLIVHMENIFKNKVKTRYYIAYSEDPIYVERLSQKSGVDQKEIKHLLNLFKGGSNVTSVSDEYLVNLYKKLNDFYSKAK